jgi:AcrR family transcriptional regulator
MADQLSAQDWIDLGLKTLAKSGFTTLKAEPLAKAMGVSRGSFYWHFADIGPFHAAVLERWREVATEQIIAGVEAARARNKGEDPLAVLLRLTFGSKHALEKAVRSWAANDARARAAVPAGGPPPPPPQKKSPKPPKSSVRKPSPLVKPPPRIS